MAFACDPLIAPSVPVDARLGEALDAVAPRRPQRDGASDRSGRWPWRSSSADCCYIPSEHDRLTAFLAPYALGTATP